MMDIDKAIKPSIDISRRLRWAAGKGSMKRQRSEGAEWMEMGKKSWTTDITHSEKAKRKTD